MGTISNLKSPFPWFGGKSRVSHLVWPRFGKVRCFVEPFAGSLAVLLARPIPFEGREVVNDLDCYVSNFWRAVSKDANSVAQYAAWPINEADLHARHQWLRAQDGFRDRMHHDPDFFDAKIAGWWVWGISCWIGSGWCDVLASERSETRPGLSDEKGIFRPAIAKQSRPHITCSTGIFRNALSKSNVGTAKGTHRQNLACFAGGLSVIEPLGNSLATYFQLLKDRLSRVSVCCGDWSRVVTDAALGQGLTRTCLVGIFLDPPYDLEVGRDTELYSSDKIQHTKSISSDVRDWCLANGDRQMFRIALCGYEGEHEMPETWECVAWKTQGGYAVQKDDKDSQGRLNRERERIWFSPHCLRNRFTCEQSSLGL